MNISFDISSIYNSGSDFLYKLRTIDLHACGEPARVVISGMPDIEGRSMAEKRLTLMTKYDHIRKILLHEPRGYPCQNANIVFPSNLPGVKYGYVILEQNCIYPMMSGHNTICVATALIYSGAVPLPEQDGDMSFDLESPGGLISIKARIQNRKVKSITIRNVPSYRALAKRIVSVPELGDVKVDIVYGGMWYCIVNTEDLPTDKKFLALALRDSKNTFSLTASNAKIICRIGEMIKIACREQYPVNHPSFDYPGCDIIVFTNTKDMETSGSHAKNAVVMSNGKLDWSKPDSWTGMLDRSPCGTGTSAVMVNMHLNGLLSLNEEFVHESIIGTQFTGKLVERTKVGEYDAFIPEITGAAWITQCCDIVVDPDDPFSQGFTLNDIWRK